MSTGAMLVNKTEFDALRAEVEKWKASALRNEGVHRANVALQPENERLRRDVAKWQQDFETEARDGQRLRMALRQILEDPDTKILDSHRDDAWEALR